MAEKFDAIVVGAGPSGNTAAYTLAKAGLKVLQIERGEYPGSKNVQGAILYADALEKVIPDFRDDAPLERHVIEQRIWVLDDNSFVGTHYRSDDYNKPPYNRYTIIRAQFDKWFSSKVREAGALLICETTVEELLMDGNRCIGVRCDRKGGEVYADVVILADGVNSTLARTKFMLPAMGSMITQAISLPILAKASSSWATSLYSRTMVSFTTSAGTPADDELPKVASPEPALTSSASAWPW